MDNVRTTLAHAWNELHQISKAFDFKKDLNAQEETDLISRLDNLEETVRQARRSVILNHNVDVGFAIVEEKEAGNYSNITHGPEKNMEDLLNCTPKEGELLVKISVKNGQLEYQEVKGYLDGQWLDC